MFEVVRAADAPMDEWRADPAFAAVDAHPICGAFGRRFYPATFGTRRDESFAVMDGDRAVLLAACTAGAEELDYFGMPIRLFPRAGLDPSAASAAIEAAFTHIDALAVREKLKRVTIADDASLGTLSAVGKQCLNRRAEAALRLTGLADLADGEAGLRQTLRKSSRSLINWGRRNLEIAILCADKPDRELFDRYREFHSQVAGRVTRSPESWDAMFDWIAAGRGELVLGFLSGELVTGTMVVDGNAATYYASGVYDRDRFDLPLGHWPLWLSMTRSAERGMQTFDLGDLPLPNAASPKEVAIGYFKRGFATTIATGIVWSWTPAAPDRENGS